MPERQPPSRQHQPDDVADHPERPGADILLARIGVAGDRREAEREQGVGRDVERGPRPGNTDDRDRHDDGGNQPAERHPRAAENDPDDIEQQRDW